MRPLVPAAWSVFLSAAPRGTWLWQPSSYTPLIFTSYLLAFWVHGRVEAYSVTLQRHWNLGLEGVGSASVPVSFLEILAGLSTDSCPLPGAKQLFIFLCPLPQLQWVSITSFRWCFFTLSPAAECLCLQQRERGDGSGQHLRVVASPTITSQLWWGFYQWPQAIDLVAVHGQVRLFPPGDRLLFRVSTALTAVSSLQPAPRGSFLKAVSGHLYQPLVAFLVLGSLC